MDNLQFYPSLTPGMLEDSGYTSDKYIFTYEYQGKYLGLQQKGTAVTKLTDPLEIWNIETCLLYTSPSPRDRG